MPLQTCLPATLTDPIDSAPGAKYQTNTQSLRWYNNNAGNDMPVEPPGGILAVCMPGNSPDDCQNGDNASFGTVLSEPSYTPLNYDSKNLPQQCIVPAPPAGTNNTFLCPSNTVLTGMGFGSLDANGNQPFDGNATCAPLARGYVLGPSTISAIVPTGTFVHELDQVPQCPANQYATGFCKAYHGDAGVKGVDSYCAAPQQGIEQARAWTRCSPIHATTQDWIPTYPWIIDGACGTTSQEVPGPACTNGANVGIELKCSQPTGCTVEATNIYWSFDKTQTLPMTVNPAFELVIDGVGGTGYIQARNEQGKWTTQCPACS